MAENKDKTVEEATTEAETELQGRVDAFIKEYKELVQKYKVDTLAFPMFVPDGQGGYKVIINQQPIDITDQPTASPFVAK